MPSIPSCCEIHLKFAYLPIMRVTSLSAHNSLTTLSLKRSVLYDSICPSVIMNSSELVSYIGFLVFLLLQMNSGFAFNCNFDSDTCGFIQSTDDQFDWTRHTGSTGSPLTGPQAGDHTSGSGYYMYIDVSGRAKGDKAVLKKTLSATDRNCLEFYFHMFSSHGEIGDLNVYVDNARRFHLSGNQENSWIRGKVNFNFTGSHLVAFEATKKDDNVGHIAIDDIKLYTCYRPENLALILETPKLNNTFLVGENVSFTCQSSAEPTPCTMSFTFPGHPGSKTESKNCSARFEIVIQGCGPAKLACQTINEEGTETTSLLLTVQDSPTTDITSKASYLEGTKVQVFCATKGCPTPTLTWTKQGDVGSISTSNLGFLILEFASIAIENGGVYKCTADNGAVGSPVSKTFGVNVFHIPKNVQLMTNNSDNVFLQGAFVSVSCNAVANPLPCTIKLYLQFNVIFSTSSSDCSASHVVSNIVGCGEQTLMCTVSNAIGTAQNVVKKIFIQVPPHRVNTIPERQSGNDKSEGSPFMLSCSASGCPTPTLTWTKTGVQEPLARGNQSTLMYSFGSLSKENTGYYNCTADNGVLDPVVSTVYINVLYTPRNTKVTTNKSSNVFLQGESVAFTCQSEANPLSCSVSLYRGSNPISHQAGADCSLSHVVTNIQGCNEVSFSCTASNGVGSGATATTFITVQVPAVITISPSKSIVVGKKGSALVVSCVAMGCPTPNVSWSKKGSGVSLAKGNGTVKYTIASLRIDDSGTYRCDADNGIIGRSVFSTIDVNVTYEPQNTKLTTNKSSDVFLFGESVEFTCSSSANPKQCTVLFLKGNVELARINSETCTTKYTLRNIEGCNLETFSCYALNSIGQGLMAHKNVTVQVPVRVSISPVNDTLVMKEGSSIDLTCKATGCPTPRITWKNSRNAKPYMETIGHHLAHNFTSVDKEDRGGHHICIVDNGILGSPVNRSIFVNIPYGPYIKPMPRQPFITLYENNQVDLTCEVDSNPVAETSWTKDNSNSIIAQGERLTLSAEQSTSGNYTCTATNGYGLAKRVTFTAKVKACQDNKCTFNTSCISRGTTYHCDCPKGLTGRLCDEYDPFKDQFTVTLYIVNIAWTNDYKDSGSPAYKLVEDRICWQMQRLFGDELSNCELTSLRKGSVISEIRLTLKRDKYRSEVLGAIKAETVNDTLGPLILDQSALMTRVEPYSSFCGDQPCQFEGTCYEQGDGYRCDCKLFRFGTQCEKGIGFIPGVAVIVIGSILLVAIIFLIAYCWRRAKRGSFANGSAEVERRLTPKKQTKSPPVEHHPLSSNNVYVSVEQDDKDENKMVVKQAEPEDPYDEATKL